MKQPSTFWKVITGFIVIFIGSILVDSWVLEPARIEHVCNKIQIGDSSNDVLDKAEKYNIRVIKSIFDDQNQQIITLHGGSFNRYICQITHNNNQVIKNEFKKMNVR